MKCIETLQQAISSKFDKIFSNAHKGDIESCVADINHILEELYAITDDVVPCFPPSYPSSLFITFHFFEFF